MKNYFTILEAMREKKMTPAQMKKREKYVKSMKPASKWEKRYPGRGEQVMYATATKMAMREDLYFDLEIESDVYGKGIVTVERFDATEKGDVAVYSVKFEHGVEEIFAEDIQIMLNKEPVEETKKPLHPNQQKLDVYEPEKDELTAMDFKKLRAMKKKGK